MLSLPCVLLSGLMEERLTTFIQGLGNFPLKPLAECKNVPASMKAHRLEDGRTLSGGYEASGSRI